MSEAQSIRRAFIPTQFISKKPFNTESGKKMKAFDIFILESNELERIFVPYELFGKLGLLKLSKAGDLVCDFFFESDSDEDWENLVNVQIVGKIKWETVDTTKERWDNTDKAGD